MTKQIYRIVYLYRDASNYKFWGELFVAGLFRPELLDDTLFDGALFVPDAIGVTSLVPSARNEGDHELHEFVEIDETTGKDFDIDAGELTRRIREAGQRGWFSGPAKRWRPVGRLLTSMVT